MANTIPSGAQPLSGTAVGTTGALSITLGGTTNLGRSVYLTGFNYVAEGATGAATVTITASYTPSSGGQVTLGTWSYPVVAGATQLAQPIMSVNLIPPVGAGIAITGATNTNPVGSIVITASAAGAGETFAGLNAWGFMQ